MSHTPSRPGVRTFGQGDDFTSPETLVCEVCRFQRDAVDRRIARLEAESLNDGPFLHRFVASAGYCPRHLRRVLGWPERGRWALPLRLALHEVARRAVEPAEPLRFEPCPLCELEHWTGEYAVSVLVSGRHGIVGGESRLRADAFVCLRHVATEFEAGGTGDALRRLRLTLEAAPTSGPIPRLTAIAGLDPSAAVRTPLARGKATPDGGAPEPITLDWLTGELEADRCPACSAVVSATRHFATSGPAVDGAHALCAYHCWDLAVLAPDLAAGALDRAADQATAWLTAGPSDRRVTQSRLRSVGAPVVVRRRRSQGQGTESAARCAVCIEQASAVARCLPLFDGVVDFPSGGRQVPCIRHLGQALLAALGSRASLRDAARERSQRMEAVLGALLSAPRSTAEAGDAAWVAGLWIAGDAVACDPWITPDLPAALPPVWPW